MTNKANLIPAIGYSLMAISYAKNTIEKQDNPYLLLGGILLVVYCTSLAYFNFAKFKGKENLLYEKIGYSAMSLFYSLAYVLPINIHHQIYDVFGLAGSASMVALLNDKVVKDERVPLILLSLFYSSSLFMSRVHMSSWFDTGYVYGKTMVLSYYLFSLYELQCGEKEEEKKH